MKTDFSMPVKVLNVGEPNGVASLDGDGKVPMSQLPIILDNADWKFGTYETQAGITESVEVQIDGFDENCQLFVFVNGMFLMENVDYTLVDNVITLETPITHDGVIVQFVSVKA